MIRRIQFEEVQEVLKSVLSIVVSCPKSAVDGGSAESPFRSSNTIRPDGIDEQEILLGEQDVEEVGKRSCGPSRRRGATQAASFDP